MAGFAGAEADKLFETHGLKSVRILFSLIPGRVADQPVLLSACMYE